MHGSPKTSDATAANEDAAPGAQRQSARDPDYVREAVATAHRRAGDQISQMSPLDQPESYWTARYSRRPPTRNPLKLVGEISRSVWAGKNLAYRLFLRNLSGRYRQTLLGLMWIVIPTLVVIGTWWFLSQQQVLKSGFENNAQFVVYIAIGSVLWQTFFDSVQAPFADRDGQPGDCDQD